MIIAGAASITARGLIERVGEVDVLWSQWFLAYVPCDILTIVIAWRLVLWLYPPERSRCRAGPRSSTRKLARMGRLNPLEWRAIALFAMASGCG